jgi:ribonuclease HI
MSKPKKTDELWAKNHRTFDFPRDWTVYNEVHLRFDGGVGPKNPGGVVTFGWTLYAVMDGAGDNIQEGFGYYANLPYEHRTNNVAEWAALVDALEWMVENKVGGHKVKIIGDSQLVIGQVSGKWKCSKDHLKALRNEAWDLLTKCCGSRFVAKWVPRHQNAYCDQLSNLAFNKHKDAPDARRD